MGLGVALERAGSVDIGLLQFDAPIAELIQRYGAAGDGAAHESARRHHLDFAVEVAKLGLALETKIAFETIQHVDRLSLCKFRAHNSGAVRS